MKKRNLNQEKSLSSFRRIVPILYFTTLIVMLCMVLLNLVLKSPNRPDEFGLGSFYEMNVGWTTASGQPFEIAEIDSLRTDGSDTVSIYYQLPMEIAKDETIVFRSKNCTVSILIGGTPVYESDVTSAPFYNHSPGTRWNLVTVRDTDAGQTVELQIKQAYQDGRAKVDNFYFGDRASITLNFIQTKLLGSVISLLIFFVALVFLAAWVVLNWHRVPKDHSLLWLALFGMVASCWSLLETNIFQLLSQDLRLIQVMDNMMLVAGGLPLYLYLDSVFKVFRSKTVCVLCGLDAAYIVLATLFQLLGLWDYHQTLNGSIATYGFVVFILIVSLAKQQKRIRSSEQRNERLFYTFQQAGILLLGLGLLGDLLRYLMMDVLDRAFMVRIGLLCFIICFGAGNIYQMILLVKKGMEAEFISRLAYTDGLTRAGNRTAYLEQLQKIETDFTEDELLIVMFDINNLKRVNDTMGHKSGDELLLTCADILLEAFCSPWHVYRIGGDEFVALIHGKNLQAAYEAAKKRFFDAIVQVNQLEEKEWPVVIAHGAATCSKVSKEAIDETEKEADRRMYQNKYQLKLEQGAFGERIQPETGC